ncbi:hypothetical protein EVAR_58473_1 [Eumeta japonica]|uniref:Uncharacterized protein n=1 Tax=Eumeta variegata TaxID=151549 RepID=A0A4C1YQ60_EUMVA|nr:hypothetical protein EVAR_58473_1 [Eumeta japonica]
MKILVDVSDISEICEDPSVWESVLSAYFSDSNRASHTFVEITFLREFEYEGRGIPGYDIAHGRYRTRRTRRTLQLSARKRARQSARLCLRAAPIIRGGGSSLLPHKAGTRGPLPQITEPDTTDFRSDFMELIYIRRQASTLAIVSTRRVRAGGGSEDGRFHDRINCSCKAIVTALRPTP